MMVIYLSLFLFIAFIIPNNNKYPNIEDSESIMNESNYINNESLIYQNISKKVIPYIVQAKVKVDNQEIIGEVIQDKGNGESYYININNEEKWYDSYYVTIIDPPVERLESLTNEEIEIYAKFSNFSSKTDYFLWVDIFRNETYVLKKDNENFKVEKRMPCSTGTNTTPTKRGMYEIIDKGESFIGRTKTYICYNYMQYSGSYLLHSFPYSLDDEILDDTLYGRVSNGCVRYSLDESKYLYDNIPLNTTIWLN